MRDTAVGFYTIGQTPRPDLEELLAARFQGLHLEIRGVLDGLGKDEVPALEPGGYPLETRLRDGTRVVVDAGYLAPRLQQLVAEWDARVAAHLVLCAGPFPQLAARRPLIQPFDVAVARMRSLGARSLEVVVPFAGQAVAAERKWLAAGFACRTHVLGNKPDDTSVAGWLADRLGTSADGAAVFDYVGYPAATLEQVGAAIEIPVFDLGHLAMDALEMKLATL